MPITTRQEFIRYCYRALGAPVIEINIDDEQTEDRVDEALEYFRLYHYEGIERLYLKHEITAADIASRTIPIPSHVYGIVRIIPYPSSGTSSSSILFDVQYQLRAQHIYDLMSSDIIHYDMTLKHLSLLDQVLNNKPSMEFNRLNGSVALEGFKDGRLKEGDFIVMEAYRALDPVDSIKVWSEPWLKHYATALIKRQWAVNLKKYTGLQLPGGVTIDGDKLYDEAIKEIQELEEDLKTKSSPLRFFIG